MTDEELVEELRFLGIDADSYEVIALLPLVQVAWADGKIQDAERALILNIAGKRGLADEGGLKVLDWWLEEPPSRHYLLRGRKVLSALVNRATGVPGSIDFKTLDDLSAFCDGVARAAGGIFGFGKVDKREKEAIGEIVRGLGIQESRSWDEIASEFND